MSGYTFTSTAPIQPPEVHEELLLKCDCGVEHLDISVWFTTNAADFRKKDKKNGKPENGRMYDAGYLTVTQGYGYNQPWLDRIKAAWQLLRGREYILSSVILNPRDFKKLCAFIDSVKP